MKACRDRAYRRMYHQGKELRQMPFWQNVYMSAHDETKGNDRKQGAVAGSREMKKTSLF
jgi:hypothetical protein